MTTVMEGPAIDDSMIEDRPVQMPFALLLGYELERLGASVSYDESFGVEGARVGAKGYRQFYVLDERRADDLAARLVAEVGKFIVFTNLWVPPKGVIYAGIERYGNVTVRRLLHYWIPTDGVVQRFDVLVKPAVIPGVTDAAPPTSSVAAG